MPPPKIRLKVILNMLEKLTHMEFLWTSATIKSATCLLHICSVQLQAILMCFHRSKYQI